MWWTVTRRSPANERGLLGHAAQMLLSSDPFWFAKGKHALVKRATLELSAGGSDSPDIAAFLITYPNGAIGVYHGVGSLPRYIAI